MKHDLIFLYYYHFFISIFLYWCYYLTHKEIQCFLYAGLFSSLFPPPPIGLIHFFLPNKYHIRNFLSTRSL